MSVPPFNSYPNLTIFVDVLRLQRVLHSMLSARILLHIRDAVTPDEPTAPRTMSFAVAHGKPDGDSTNVELGELQSYDSSRYIRTNSSRMGAIVSVSIRKRLYDLRSDTERIWS